MRICLILVRFEAVVMSKSSGSPGEWHDGRREDALRADGRTGMVRKASCPFTALADVPNGLTRIDPYKPAGSGFQVGTLSSRASSAAAL